MSEGDVEFALVRHLAPGVFRLLHSPLLCPEETRRKALPLLEDHFSEGLLDYPELPRENGVSFNPLPARLVEILLRECRISEIEIVEETLIFSKVRLLDDSRNWQNQLGIFRSRNGGKAADVGACWRVGSYSSQHPS